MLLKYLRNTEVVFHNQGSFILQGQIMRHLVVNGTVYYRLQGVPGLYPETALLPSLEFHVRYTTPGTQLDWLKESAPQPERP